MKFLTTGSTHSSTKPKNFLDIICNNSIINHLKCNFDNLLKKNKLIENSTSSKINYDFFSNISLNLNQKFQSIGSEYFMDAKKNANMSKALININVDSSKKIEDNNINSISVNFLFNKTNMNNNVLWIFAIFFIFLILFFGIMGFQARERRKRAELREGRLIELEEIVGIDE